MSRPPVDMSPEAIARRASEKAASLKRPATAGAAVLKALEALEGLPFDLHGLAEQASAVREVLNVMGAHLASLAGPARGRALAIAVGDIVHCADGFQDFYDAGSFPATVVARKDDALRLRAPDGTVFSASRGTIRK